MTNFIKVDLKDRVAVVTGATRGIGFGIAEAFARNGAKVALIGTNAEKLQASTESIRAIGVEAEMYICNVSQSDDVTKTTAAILERFGKKVDILVNNAGITRDKLIRVMTDADWDDVISINLRGTFLMTRAFVEPMRRAKYGRIINISSVSGLQGNRGQCNYSASKAGVIGFTRTLSLELANRGITANCIAPGFVETDMTAVLDDIVKTAAKGMIPVGRFGLPEEIANAALFFASESSGYVTGQCIAVDGGMTV
ncbi:MAG: 3-oxoacyl-[acyl-carrier-protein] reductase [Planctomycetaceae bacterium]|jgi:3-oxoacyl-[acyl-carrier protein] reductase|nr:3-oxoacyl-[acyl-carrier-protein] reductase [Planctomycetaceae bacterium]